ncbi:MAG: DUF1015 domain-containing protein [Fluviicola sp.]|nr:DUF1015 domain-containing protein [Fluviicola sp.]
MAEIHPFKAVRPTRDKAHLVATRPLASYKKHILKAKLEDNPYTFLHIIHPEVDKTTKTKHNSPERFQAVKQRFELFLKDGILFQDQTPSIYIYRQTKGKHAFTGVIAGASIAEYNNNLIKKHEATLTSREEMFTNYLDIVGFNAEPVLLSHEPSDEIEAFLDVCTKVRPEYEFSTVDYVKHELWVLDSQQTATIQQLFEKIPALYIADGHHRSASSARLADKLVDSPFTNPRFFLSFLIDERRMRILEFNRLVKTLNGYTIDSFLAKLSESFDVTLLAEGRNPLYEHELTCYLKGTWYSLTCKAEICSSKDPVASLDAQILTDVILSPILGITDLKTDQNISFVSGAEGLKAVVSAVDKGLAEVGFVLFPIRMEQVKAVADHQLIMPPKSTWVEPKIRSGLTIYNINE